MSTISAEIPVAESLENQRAFPRLKLHSIPGFLVLADTEEELLAFPVDINPGGLGILSTDFLIPGDRLRLKAGSDRIDFMVVWRSLDEDPGVVEEGLFLENLYRYGLKLTSAETDLMRFFSDRGCLRKHP